jgi:DNA-binding winged helix-turn-helix (wHTH) protein/predicted Zn-dependent protease
MARKKGPPPRHLSGYRVYQELTLRRHELLGETWSLDGELVGAWGMLDSRLIVGKTVASMPLEKQSPAILRFGVFEVDVRAGELRKQGVRIKLQEQPFHVLTVLLQRPGEVVTREELRSENWSEDTFVDFDNSLNTAINKLREALGDSADNPRFIETLHRRGYRFIAPVGSKDQKEQAIGNARWKLSATMAIVVVAAIAVTAGSIWRVRQARKLSEKDMIVLADFANSTGDPVFDDTLKQGLRVQLEQSPFLNILSDQKVSDVLQMMKLSKDERLTPDVTREVCQRTGSKAILVGSISSLGKHYVIGLNALNCRTGDGLASEQVEADSRERVLKALGESTTRMRKKLGESLVSVQRYDAPVEATTPSLEALKAYSLGMKTWFAKGVTASLPFFQRAAVLDPHFAMAHARVAMVYWNLNENALAAENMHKAYELRDRVTEWERLYIEAHYYDRETGELEKAAHVYELWQQTYPRDWVPYNNLASLNAAFGKYEEALEDAQQALRLEPDNEDNYAVATLLYLSLNRLDEAGAVLKQAAERKLESELLLAGRYQLAFLRGDEGEMERLVAGAAGKPGAESSLWFCEVVAAAYQGRRSKARGLARQGGEAAERNGSMEEGATSWLATAMTEGYFGNTQQARADARAALRLTRKGYVPVWAAQALALAGDVTGAEKLAEESNRQLPLDTGVQKYWLPMIRANVALDFHNPDKAIELLHIVSPYELGTFGSLNPIYTRGQAYLMQRNGSAAAAEFQKIIDHRGVVWASPLGALAHLGLARAYALQGDTAKSRAAYQDFLTLWKDADPDIPILKQAKAEYTNLQ